MPIKGTPLENQPLLSPEDILRTIAFFRYINPTANIRLAAGRKLLPKNGADAFTGGASATITGNMLTTSGSSIQDDINMLHGDISREEIQSMLMKFFRPEFLNRVDDIVVFKALEQVQIKGIVKLILTELGERLHNQMELTLTYDDSALEYLAKAGFDPDFGARPLKRLIVHTVETIVSKKIVAGEIKSGDKIEVVYENDAIDVKVL